MAEEATYKPDAPFRNGTSGKYKLLIKRVIPNSYDYEYELTDADGKDYKATSEVHYPENQLLRCMISFVVVSARLAVSETKICNKQDLTIPIPEDKKPKPLVQPKPTKESKVKKTPSKLGDPRKTRVSGYYNLRVVEVEQNDSIYSYVVEDAKGQQYHVQSNYSYRVGVVVPCKVRVFLTPGGNLQVSVTSVSQPLKNNSSGKEKKHHTKHRNDPFQSFDSWPSPAAGDHFHLIYTPMGNKR